MLSLPQAWAGAIIALTIAHEPLSLIAMIGIVYLNAIVNKNAILLVDYTNTLRGRGYKRLDAILEAAPIRLRPILMTTFTIIVSTLPTALALGRGAGFRQSLGVARCRRHHLVSGADADYRAVRLLPVRQLLHLAGPGHLAPPNPRRSPRLRRHGPGRPHGNRAPARRGAAGLGPLPLA